MTWINADGLFVKFAKEEADNSPGGEVSNSSKHEVVFEIDYTDVQSATPTILGTVGTAGTYGVWVPKGARIEALETIVKTAFTSSGTIGSSNISIGTKKTSDFSTELDHDGLTTSAFVGGVFDAAGERTYVVPGVTGAGDDYGTTTAENGVICVANAAHATNPLTAGRLLCRLFFYLP